MGEMNHKVQFRVGFEADTTKVQLALDSLQLQLSKMSQLKFQTGATTGLKEASVQADKLQLALQKAYNPEIGRIDLSKFNQSLRTSNTNVEKIGSSFSTVGKKGQDAFINMADAVSKSEAKITTTNKTLQGFAQTLTNTLRWTISAGLINSVTGVLSESVAYLKTLDTSLNNIRIVTGKSSNEMKNFAGYANNAAKSLSSTTTDYTNAALLYYQQGDTDKRAKEKATITTKATNVSPNSNSEEMSNYLTSVWNGFGMQNGSSKKLEGAADKLAYLGAQTATSFEEIAISMSKLGATAKTTGVTLDQTAAIIATVSSATREAPEKVGTAFKTVFSRIMDIKQDKKTGKLTYGTQSGKLKNLGFDVLNDDGTMKKAGNVVEEIGNKWEGMTRKEKQAIVGVVAGKQQMTQVNALFNNWKSYNKNLDMSMNDSAGSLEKMQKIYEQSWVATSKRVKAALQGIMQNAVNSKDLIGAIDTFGKLLNRVGDVTKAIGGIGPALLLSGAVMINHFAPSIENGAKKAINSMNLFGETAVSQSSAIRNSTNDTLNALMPVLNSTNKIKARNIQTINSMKIELEKASKSMTAAQIADGERAISLYSEEAEMLGKVEIKMRGIQESSRKEATKNQASANMAMFDKTHQNKNSAQRREDLMAFKSQSNDEQIAALGNKRLNINNKDSDILKMFNLRSNSSKITYQKYVKTMMQLPPVFKTIDVEADKLINITENLGNEMKATGKYSQESMQTIKESLKETSVNFSEAVKSLPYKSEEVKTLSKSVISSMRNIDTMGADALNDLVAQFTKLNVAMQASAEESRDMGFLLLEENEEIAQGVTAAVDAESKSLINKFNADKIAMESEKSAIAVTGRFKESLRNTGTQAIRIAGALGQVAFGLQMVQSAKNIWDDKDLSTGEKVLDTFVDLSFTLPFVVSGLKDAGEAIKALTGAKGASNLLNLIPFIGGGKAKEVKSISTKILKKGPALGDVAVEAAGGAALVKTGKKFSSDAIKGLSKGNIIKNVLPAAADIEKVTQKLSLLTDGVGSFAKILGPVGIAISAVTAGFEIWKNLFPSGQSYIFNKDKTTLSEYKKAAKSTSDELKDVNKQIKDMSSQKFDSSDIEKYNELIQEQNELKVKNEENNSKVEDKTADVERDASVILNSGFKYNTGRTISGVRGTTTEQTAYGKNAADSITSQSQYLLDIRNRINKGSGDMTQLYKEYCDGQKSLMENIESTNTAAKSVIEQGQEIASNTKNSVKVRVDATNASINAAKTINAGNFAKFQTGEKFSISKAYADTLVKGFDSGTLDLQQYKSDKFKRTKLNNKGDYTSNLQDLYENRGSEKQSKQATKAVQGLVNSARAFSSGSMGVKAYANSMLENVNSAMDSLDKLGSKTSSVMSAIKDSLSDATLNLASAFQNGTISGKEFLTSFSKIQESQISVVSARMKKNKKDYEDYNKAVLNGNKKSNSTKTGYNQYLRDIATKKELQSYKNSNSALQVLVKNKKTALKLLDSQGNLSRSKLAKAMIKGDKAAIKMSNDFLHQMEKTNDSFKKNSAHTYGNLTTDSKKFYQSSLEQAKKASKDKNLTENQYYNVLHNLRAGNLTDEQKAQIKAAGTAAGATNAVVNVIKSAYAVIRDGVNSTKITIKASKFSLKDGITLEGKMTDAMSKGTMDKSLSAFGSSLGDYLNSSSSSSGGSSGSGGNYSVPTGTGTGTGSSGSKGSKAKLDKADLIDIDTDPFEKINALLDEYEKKLTKITTLKDSLYGQKYVDEIDDEIAANKKSLSLQESRIKLAKSQNTSDLKKVKHEIKILKSQEKKSKLLSKKNVKALKDISIETDEDGTITNTKKVLSGLAKKINSSAKKYNSGSRKNTKKNKALKASLNKMKSEYDKLQDLMDKNNDAVDNKTDAEQTAAEIKNTISDNALEKITYVLDLKVNISDATKSQLDAYITQYGDKWQNAIKYYNSMYAKAKVQQGEDDAYGNALQSIYQDKDINNKTKIENITTQKNNLISSYSDYVSELTSLNTALSDSFDKVNTELNLYETQIDAVTTRLGHYSTLINSLTDSSKYHILSQISDTQVKITENALAGIKAQQAAAQAIYQQALKTGSDDDINKAKATLDTINNDILGKVETLISNIQDAFSAGVADILNDLEKQVTNNSTFTALQDQYSTFKTISDLYLSDVEKNYNFNKLERSVQEQIDNNTSTTQTKRLKKLQDEFKAVQSQANVSKSELDYEQAKYDLELKKIALEDAQNNKSKTRLVRNSQGNYSYQYVADSAAVSKAQQDYEDSQEKVYSVAKSALDDYESKLSQLGATTVSQIKSLDKNDVDYESKVANIKNIAITEAQTYSDQISKFIGYTKDAGSDLLTEINKQYTEDSQQENFYTDVDSMKTSVDTFITQLNSAVNQITSNFEDMNNAISQIEKNNGVDLSSMTSTISNSVLDASSALIKEQDAANTYLASIPDLVTSIDNLKVYLDGQLKSINSYLTIANRELANLTGDKSLLTDMPAFDTGGYTGDWGSGQGKVAMLHEKEIVLNKADTQNILSTVSILKDMQNVNFGDKITEALSGLGDALNDVHSNSASDTGIKQTVEINANFPDASSADEIKSAFNSLANEAAQYINKNTFK